MITLEKKHVALLLYMLHKCHINDALALLKVRQREAKKAGDRGHPTTTTAIGFKAT